MFNTQYRDQKYHFMQSNLLFDIIIQILIVCFINKIFFNDVIFYS